MCGPGAATRPPPAGQGPIAPPTSKHCWPPVDSWLQRRAPVQTDAEHITGRPNTAGSTAVRGLPRPGDTVEVQAFHSHTAVAAPPTQQHASPETRNQYRVRKHVTLHLRLARGRLSTGRDHISRLVHARPAVTLAAGRDGSRRSAAGAPVRPRRCPPAGQFIFREPILTGTSPAPLHQADNDVETPCKSRPADRGQRGRGAPTDTAAGGLGSASHGTGQRRLGARPVRTDQHTGQCTATQYDQLF